MKKIIALLLIALMCFSVASCGADDSQQGTGSNQSQGNSENNNEPRKVAITMDNWTEYFNIVTEEGIFTLPDGAEKADIRYSVALKDGIVLDQNTWELVTFDFSYNSEKRSYTVDENKNITWEKAETTEAQTGSREIPVGDSGSPLPKEIMQSSKSGKTGDGKPYTVVAVDFEITNVTGNIYIK